jgi:hypothetical protein
MNIKIIMDYYVKGRDWSVRYLRKLLSSKKIRGLKMIIWERQETNYEVVVEPNPSRTQVRAKLS